MIKLVNLTPHAINLIVPDGNGGETLIVVPPSGAVARCAVTRRVAYLIETPEGFKIPVNHTSFGEVEGLPDPEPGVAYIVSTLVAQAARERSDIYVVDDTVRDEAGRIVGARALARV